MARGTPLLALFIALSSFCLIRVYGIKVPDSIMLAQQPTKTSDHDKLSAKTDVNLTTNAQRLARGLTPLKPKRFFDPSRTRPLAARQSLGLPTPGYIALGEPGNPDVICFLADTVCESDPNDAFEYSAYLNYGPQTLTNVQPVAGWNLQLQSGGFPTPPLTQSEFDQGLGRGLLSAGMAYTPPGSGPKGNGFETSVFYLDSQGFMNAVWIDATTGDSITLQVLYDPSSLNINIYLTNDPTNYAALAYSDDGADDGDTLVSAFLFFYTGPI